MVIGERYRIIGSLGKGGMSRVYLAEDLRLHMKVAVKVISCHEGYLAEAVISEANVLRTVRQENLVRITDIFKWDNNACLVMEYVEGYRLSDLIKRNPGLVKRNAFDFSISLMHALEALHERPRPIIYRDMKPDNIMVRPDLRICLIDFGTAKKENGNKRDETALGTRNYAAPEQLKGRTDVRSDIFSLGKTMEKMAGDSPDPSIRAVIKKAVSLDPEKRYRSVKEMERDLKRRRHRKIRIIALLSALLCAVLVLSSLIWGLRQRRINNLIADLYRRTVESGNEALYNSDYTAAEMYYSKAILEINGNEEEAYRKLLNLYRKAGGTGDGLDRIDSFIESGYGGLRKKNRLLYECALAAFEDLRDFKRAGTYFRMTDGAVIPEAVYLTDISEYLSSFEKDPDKIISRVREFRDYTESMGDSEGKAEDRLILTDICLTLSEEISENSGEASGALLLEGYSQGRKYLESMEAKDKKDVLSLNMMSAICRLLGEKFPEKRRDYFMEAISYMDMARVPGSPEDADRLISIAKLYQEIGDRNMACETFKKAEEEGSSASAYTEHMKYLESLNRYSELMELYELSLSVNGIRETKEYRKLVKRMEKKGLLKG